MSRSIWTTGRVSGTLLVLSFAIIAVEFVVVLTQGKFEGVEAAWEGVEGIGEAATVFRDIDALRSPQVVLLFLGFGMLTVHLSEAGDRALSFLAFNLFMVFVILAAMEDTFHSEVTAWAGEEWARTGAVPEFFDPLREWVNGPVQLRYVTFVNTSMAFYGWAFLRTGVLPRWIGWSTLIWSLGWLILAVVIQLTLPATYILLPLLLGVALIVHREGPQDRERIPADETVGTLQSSQGPA